MVEKLDGMDLDDFLLLPEDEASLKDKFQVMLHVTRQYKAIDKAGFVLFDRHAFNVMLLSWEDGKISTRQVDVDQIYDKETDASYSMERQESFESMNDAMNKLGKNLWSQTVMNLLSQELKTVDINRNREITELLREKKENVKAHGSDLDEHENVLMQIIEKL